MVYAKFSFPIIQERDLLLYIFINNKLKENKTIQFLCKSCDKDEAVNHYDTVKLAVNEKNDKDILRIFLDFYSLEIQLIDDRRVALKGYIFINPSLKHLEENFIEILVRQYIKKMIFNLEETCKGDFDNKIEKTIHKEESSKFYDFYQAEIAKHINGEDR